MADPLKILGEPRVWLASRTPGRQRLPHRRQGLAGDRDETGHGVAATLDEEGIAPVSHSPEDVTQLAGELGGGDLRLHIPYNT